MAASTDTPTGLIALVAAQLAAIAPTGFGLDDSAQHGSPRRFVWVPVESPLDGPKRNGSAHYIDSVGLRWAVECWGYTFDDSFYLMAALLTAIQRAWGGRNYVANQVQPWEQRERHKGFVMAVQVEMRLNIPAIDLSAPPPPPPKKTSAVERPPADGLAPPDDPAPVYEPTGTTTVQITAVAEATPALSSPGDGVLEGQES